jgi:hypothetical protein
VAEHVGNLLFFIDNETAPPLASKAWSSLSLILEPEVSQQQVSVAKKKSAEKKRKQQPAATSSAPVRDFLLRAVSID